MDSDRVIRPTVRAVILRGDLVLVQVKIAASGARYLTLPGGRQKFGETLEDCVRRECLEEIGIAPTVGGIRHVADVFRQRGHQTRHLVEILFDCFVPADYEPRMGPRPDKRQTATIWADPDALGPEFLPRYDVMLKRSDAPVHLGRLDCVIA